MSLIVAVTTAIVLLLLALKLSQRFTLRLRVLAGVSLSRPATKSCPHLGMASDPFSHDSHPTEDHRCYLWMQRDRVDLVHQKGFCLSTAHHKCPWLMMRRPDAPPPLHKRLPALVGGAPRAVWGGLRLTPGLVASAVLAVRGVFRRRTAEPARVVGLSDRLSDAPAASVWARPAAPEAPAASEWVRPVAADATAAPAWASSAVPEPAAAEELVLGWPAASVAPEPGPTQTKPRRTQHAAATWRALTAAVSAAATELSSAVRKLSPRLGEAMVVAGRGLRVAAVSSARGVRIAALWLAPRLAAAAVAFARAVWAGVCWLLPRLWLAFKAVGAAARKRAHTAPILPETVVAIVEAPQLVVEPVLPASLAKLEELLAEGLAALDRGEEGLAFHIFAKATEQRVPKGEQYADVMKRAWFWRAKTAETVEDVVHSLELALKLDPGNLQMQAHLAWARQRLEREQKLLPLQAEQPMTAPAQVAASALKPKETGWWASLGIGVRLAGAFMALALALLWMTTGVIPALGSWLSQLPAGDELMVRRVLLTLNSAALPGHGHWQLPVLDYDVGLSLPFILAFLFVFTARGLLDGDTWARSSGLVLAGLGGWLCAAVVANPDAGRLGLGLCLGVIVAAVVGRFEPARTISRQEFSY